MSLTGVPPPCEQVTADAARLLDTGLRTFAAPA